MTWKQVQQNLNISDFTQYRAFVLQCPNIQDYVTLVTSKGAIEMGIIKLPSEDTIDDIISSGDTTRASPIFNLTE